MLGNGVRVRSFVTDVMRDRCAPIGVVVRCVSTADSSLSLSLSLCSQFLSAENGSRTHLLAGSDHAPGRGFHHVRSGPFPSGRFIIAAPFACARVNSLGQAPHNPWSSSEEALSRAYFPRAGSVGPKRRGPLPNRGPRRSLLFAGPATRGLFERHRSLPNGALAFEEVPSRTPIRAGTERRGPSDPWVTAPPLYCHLGKAGPELHSGQVSPDRKERPDPARVSPVESNVRMLRPWVKRAGDLDPAGPTDPAAAAERFLRERHLDLRFNPTGRRPISGRSHPAASTPHSTRKKAYR